jgi:hypothetical protein
MYHFLNFPLIQSCVMWNMAVLNDILKLSEKVFRNSAS